MFDSLKKEFEPLTDCDCYSVYLNGEDTISCPHLVMEEVLYSTEPVDVFIQKVSENKFKPFMVFLAIFLNFLSSIYLFWCLWMQFMHLGSVML